MKRLYIKRSICALLILIFLFSFVSCSSENPSAEGRLEITEQSLKYSEEYTLSAAERLSDILNNTTDETLKALLGMNRQDTLITFTDKIIPKLCELKVYEEELDEIFFSLENLLNSENNPIPPLSSLYDSLLYTLGSHRMGILLHTVSIEIMSVKISTARDRYEKYGYSWYLADMERCENLKADLENMGEEHFSEIISAATFIISTLNSAVQPEESALALSDSELLFILEHQGKEFLSSNSDREEWQIIGRLITELLPGIDFTDKVPLHILYALKQEAYFDSLMQTMPYFFKLYASLTQSLKDEGIFSLSNSKKENERAIYSALLSSEAELREFYDSLIAYGSIDSDRLRRAVEDCYNKNEIDEFLNSHSPLSYDSLTAEIERCVRGDEGAKSAEELIVGTLYSVSPYLTFIFFG